MPNYPFVCKDCKKRFQITLSYDQYGETVVHCPHCKSENVQRRISRVRMLRSESSRLDSIGDPSMLEGIEDDPRAMAKMMRQMSSEMGEELGPEFDEVVDRLEAGQSPEDIEKDLPDLGDEF
jgi:putative FmdB family regulatory protein